MLGGGRIEGEVAVNTVPLVETAELRFGAGLGDGWGGEVYRGQRRGRDRSSRCGVVRRGPDGESFGQRQRAAAPVD